MGKVDLSGKTALVTGARAGIGAATGLHLAASGANVIFSGRKPGDCQPHLNAVHEAGGRAVEIAMDVSDLGEIARTMPRVIDAFGGLDIVVNNAAVIAPQAPIGEIDAGIFDLAQRINLTAPLAIVNAAWPHLKQGGRVLNVLSGAARRPTEGWAAYCASKAGLLMLTRQMDLEGQPHGVRAFGLAPGVVDTDMQAAIRAAKQNEVANIPRAALDSPQWAAEAITWLVSGEGDAHAGEMVDIRDPALRTQIGLPALEQ